MPSAVVNPIISVIYLHYNDYHDLNEKLWCYFRNDFHLRIYVFH